MSKALDNKKAWQFQGTAASKDVTTNSADNTPDRVTLTGDGGLLGTVIDPAGSYSGDLNNLDETVFFSADGSTANVPPFAGNWMGIHLKRVDDIYAQFAVSRSSGVVRAAIRKTNDGTFSEDWEELYHTGNLNIDVFGGGDAGDTIAFGTAATSSVGVFEFNLNYVNNPTGISLSGAVDIRIQDSTGTLVGSGITSVTLVGRSSNKQGVVSVSGLSGATQGDRLEMRIVNNGDKITVAG